MAFYLLGHPEKTLDLHPLCRQTLAAAGAPVHARLFKTRSPLMIKNVLVLAASHTFF